MSQVQIKTILGRNNQNGFLLPQNRNLSPGNIMISNLKTLRPSGINKW